MRLYGNRGLFLLSVFMCAVLAQSCTNRRIGSTAQHTEADKQAAQIDYAFGPMTTGGSAVGAKLVPFRSVSARGGITVLSGMTKRYDGDSVFKLQYTDGSQLWLVQER